jgi:phosphohistidine phosphatase SixA
MRRLFLWLMASLITGTVGARTDLADRLQGHDYVMLMRHAYAPGVGDPHGYTVQRCESQRLLNEEGRDQSLRIGQWLRAQGVEKAQVHSSVWCRCQQTAELLKFGAVKVEPSLASFFDEPQQATVRNQSLQQFIAKTLKTKGDRALILVTHHVNIREFMGQDIGSGDMVLARVNPRGQLLDYKLFRSP